MLNIEDILTRFPAGAVKKARVVEGTSAGIAQLDVQPNEFARDFIARAASKSSSASRTPRTTWRSRT